MAGHHSTTSPASAAAAATLVLLLVMALASLESAAAYTWKCQKGWEVAGWNSCRICKPNYVIAATLSACQSKCSGTTVGRNPNNTYVWGEDCEFVVFNMKGECHLRNSWNDGPDGKTAKEYGTIACRKVND